MFFIRHSTIHFARSPKSVSFYPDSCRTLHQKKKSNSARATLHISHHEVRIGLIGKKHRRRCSRIGQNYWQMSLYSTQKQETPTGKDLLSDHESIIDFLRGNITPFAEKYKDYGTSDSESTTGKAPVRWKQFLVTWSAIYPLSLVIPHFLLPLLRLLNIPKNHYFEALLISGITVLLMVFIVMPVYTRAIRKWLYQ